METEILIQLVSNNMIGVLFGWLMYKQANGSIKDMTTELKELVLFLRTKNK